MASKRKTTSAVIAVALAAAILLGGTFAWQSISQEALNEVYGFVNPGGRLHDDFHEITYNEDGTVAKDANGNEYTTRHFDKNVYVENFTTILEDGVQIFARVRLDEYMEVGKGAGDPNADVNKAESLVNGATLGDKTSWRTHIPGDTTDPFHDYWDWTMAGDTEGEDGSTYYMPTFNKNKDSLAADVNGSFAGADGNYIEGKSFDDYVEYSLTENHDPTKNEIHDVDDNDVDELTNYNVNLNALINGEAELEERFEPHVSLERATHYADETLGSDVIMMEDWLKLPDGEKIGNYWVWDIDGWAYWAAPIDPSTATGVFLDGIARTPKIINEDWYYGINVVAQFVTVDDLGKENNTGFYADGETVSSNALRLLSKIGVKVNTEVSDVDTLNAALALGGDVMIAAGTSIDVSGQTVKASESDDNLSNIFWQEGGSISGGKLVTGDADWGIFINAEKNWPEEGDGYGAAVISDMTIESTENDAAVIAQALDAPITLNNVIITADKVGFFADASKEVLTLNNCNITSFNKEDSGKDWKNTAVFVGYDADVVINGGSYEGNYVVAFASTGENNTVTINDGTFNGDFLVNDDDMLIIKGGTFDHDPTDYVADGYKAVEVAENSWKVTTA